MWETLAPTILVLVAGAIGWFVRSWFEARTRAEEALRADRAKTYTEILEPFARLFTDLSKESQAAALSKLTSFEYRKQAFQLALVGSDGVVRAWNDMWSTLYKLEKESAEQKEVILAFGDVLLAIRKGIGNKGTKVSRKDMLRWLIKDVDEL